MTLTLEDFSTFSHFSSGQSDGFVPSAQIETEKSAAYEAGYSAGWDDAIQAEASNQARIGEEFARHLQEMSFSFHEARTHVIKGMEPLLQELLNKFLPAIIRDTMGARIVEILEPLIADAADTPVQIAVAPGCESAIEPLLSASGIDVVQITGEPTLSEGQAFLKLGQCERKIDLTQAVEQIATAIQAVYQLNERELRHG